MARPNGCRNTRKLSPSSLSCRNVCSTHGQRHVPGGGSIRWVENRNVSLKCCDLQVPKSLGNQKLVKPSGLEVSPKVSVAKGSELKKNGLFLLFLSVLAGLFHIWLCVINSFQKDNLQRQLWTNPCQGIVGQIWFHADFVLISFPKFHYESSVHAKTTGLLGANIYNCSGKNL